MKNHIILTTRGGKIFALNCESLDGDLNSVAQNIRTKLNAKYSGSDYEITDYHFSDASEVDNFWELPPSILGE